MIKIICPQFWLLTHWEPSRNKPPNLFTGNSNQWKQDWSLAQVWITELSHIQNHSKGLIFPKNLHRSSSFTSPMAGTSQGAASQTPRMLDKAWTYERYTEHRALPLFLLPYSRWSYFLLPNCQLPGQYERWALEKEELSNKALDDIVEYSQLSRSSENVNNEKYVIHWEILRGRKLCCNFRIFPFCSLKESCGPIVFTNFSFCSIILPLSSVCSTNSEFCFPHYLQIKVLKFHKTPFSKNPCQGPLFVHYTTLEFFLYFSTDAITNVRFPKHAARS